jgi:hypothetical protein
MVAAATLQSLASTTDVPGMGSLRDGMTDEEFALLFDMQRSLDVD